jgi:hypothetical protein
VSSQREQPTTHPTHQTNQPVKKQKHFQVGVNLFWLQAQAIMAKKEDEKMEDYIDGAEAISKLM